MGIDEQGREILSYVAGDVPSQALPDWATTPEVLQALAVLVRRLHWLVPLVDPVDRPQALVDADAAQRVRLFADAYGMDRTQRAAVVPTAVVRAANSTLTMRAAAQVDPVFLRWWDAGLDVSLPRAERWLAEHADRMQDRLLR